MENTSFKERVRQAAVANALIYKSNFIEFEYLLCSQAFSENKYNIVKADEGNYLHLLGINTKLNPKEFFDKCHNNTLTEQDFDFIKPNQDEKSVKGSVRQKIKVLPNMMNMFKLPLLAQENFKKNRVDCAFATSDNILTLGYAKSGRPKSLMQKNELDSNTYKAVDMIFQKKRGTEKFTKLQFGSTEMIGTYKEYIKEYLDETFL